MLAVLGITTILLLLAAILTKTLSPLVALIAVPLGASLLGGFGLKTADFIVDGVTNNAPFVGMFVFAILYFGIVNDAGMFDPIIEFVLKMVGNKPSRIVPGTALLAMIAMLDGSGATTFLIVIPVMRPLYEQLQMDRRLLACAAGLGAGVMNILPWGGPTIRAAAALELEVSHVFWPLVPAIGCGLLYVFAVSYWLGHRESKRLQIGSATIDMALRRSLTKEETVLRRPRLRWINLGLTLALVATLVSGLVHPLVVFMIGTTIGLVLNYPNPMAQRDRIDAHSKTALMMASILLAAGAFTGIMKGTGMLNAMASSATYLVSSDSGNYLTIIVAFLSMPLSLLFDPDSYYFGVLPVIAQVGSGIGVPKAQIAQASLMGMMTTGFPISPLTPSTFLLVGLSGVELGEHQRFSIPIYFGTTCVMAITGILLGIIV